MNRVFDRDMRVGWQFRWGKVACDPFDSPTRCLIGHHEMEGRGREVGKCGQLQEAGKGRIGE